MFADMFIAELEGSIDEVSLKIVYDKLCKFQMHYDIKPISTALTIYEGYIPKEYMAYVASRKVEGKSLKTIKNQNYTMMDFFKHIGKPMQEVTINDLRLYLADLQHRSGCSDRTLETKRCALSAFFKWLAEEDYIEKNPALKLKPIKYEKIHVSALTEVEFEEFRSACQTVRERFIVEMIFSTGCRVSELAAMDISDVNLQTKEVAIHGKGKKFRTTYINASSEVYIKRYLDERKDNCEALLVSTRGAHRVSVKAIEDVVKKIGDRCGLHVFPHKIRHTTATVASKRGMPLEEVQIICGHSSPETTLQYVDRDQVKIKNDFLTYIH